MTTLDEAKLHLRVEHDAEDDYITGLIAAAEGHIAEYLGDIPDPMPEPIKAAALLLVADLYENRTRQGVPLSENSTYTLLLNPYRSMSVAP